MTKRSSTDLRRVVPSILAGVAAGALGLTSASAAFAAPGAQSFATAQVANVNMPGSSFATSDPPTSASNDGSGSNAEVVGHPSQSGFTSAPGILKVTRAPQLSELVEANADGSSYACASAGHSAVASGGGGHTCVPGGNPFTGFAFFLHNIYPTLAASSGLKDFSISAKSFTAHAYDDGTGSPVGDVVVEPTAASAPANSIRLTICAATTLVCPAAISVPLSTSPNQDVIAAILATISSTAGYSAEAAALQQWVGQVTITENYQVTRNDGSLQVTAMHLLGTGGETWAIDMATVTVGPNTVPQVDTPLISGNTIWPLVGAALLAAVVVGVRAGRRNRSELGS
jgi:hypothetical protein